MLAARLMEIAQSASNSGETAEDAVEKALGEAQNALATEDPELVKFAVKVFVTHHPHGTALRIRPFEVREPEKALPSVPHEELIAAATSAPDTSTGDASTTTPSTNPELKLNWFREDPKINEHHEHWHVVYDILGVPSPANPIGGQLKDRQGELFLYMHRQMMARYDTERLCAGLDLVAAWQYYANNVDPWGYDPGPYLTGPQGNYTARTPGRWADIQESTVAALQARGDHLFEAAQSGYFGGTNHQGQPRHLRVSINDLGATQEADIGSIEAVPYTSGDLATWYQNLVNSYYGNHHNVGHDMFAFMGGNPSHQGVMGDTTVAVRDHVFFRWHRHIDDLLQTFQQYNLEPYDFSDAPPVRIRKRALGLAQFDVPNRSPDIILAFAKDLPPDQSTWQAFGEQTFGGDNWDKEFFSGGVTTDELQTSMLQRTINIEPGREDPQNPEPSHTIWYLDQEEFVYFIRVENQQDQPTKATLRLFLAAEENVEDRRMWIEMDKFEYELAGAQKAVICRPAALSSVIRKPGVKPPSAEQPPVGGSDPQTASEVEANYCDCGWPYNLLLPRGTGEGKRFRLFVMATDWNLDDVGSTSCGSMSFCGSKNQYPDNREMGYPFNHPFGDRTIADVVTAQENIATRDINIRWTNPGDYPV
jgi:hypothetical protein